MKYAFNQFNNKTPRSRRLVTGKNTKVLVYSTGHGGDGYMKMQDTGVVMDDLIRLDLEESYSKDK